MTAIEMLADVRACNPRLRLAVSSDGSALAYWSDTTGQFVPFLAALCDGRWVAAALPSLPPGESWVE